MAFFLFLPGADALSQFRQQRLLGSLIQQGVNLESIEAQYLHFIWSDKELTPQEEGILNSLLTYGQKFVFRPQGISGLFSKSPDQSAIVIPRLGTVSPWASKATDIARQCGLNILRIERGIQFTWQSKKSLSPEQSLIILAL
ncbi:MAG: phosphoribosylformylglycinamidine synthase, partial [Betaproteobacteria bacterium]|nr:phosphoribosylformylglycinamidine synthase [Betaproteobacteria bacterium]